MRYRTTASARERRRAQSRRSPILLAALILASTASAHALCTPDEVRHDRTQGPYVTYARSTSAPKRWERLAFTALNAALRKRLTRYTDYRAAVRDGYTAVPAPGKLAGAGTLVWFLPDAPPSQRLDPDHFSILFYRRTADGLRLIGAALEAPSGRLGPPSPAELNGMLPTSLAHWHTIQTACRAPGWANYYGTFLIRAHTLDWSWPGLDIFDLAGGTLPNH